MIGLAMIAMLSQGLGSVKPLRPPNGRYVYSMSYGRQIIFKSTIVVKGDGSTFSISESTKLPNGAIATTRSTWSSAALLPLSFEVHQRNVTLRARITSAAVRFAGVPAVFTRIKGSSCILPSVGLIANSMMLPYVVTAHPGESITLAEIQNNQTVLVQPHSKSPTSAHREGDMAIFVTKEKRHGDTAGEEQIVTWLNPRTGIMDGGRAAPGDATITLVSFSPSER